MRMKQRGRTKFLLIIPAILLQISAIHARSFIPVDAGLKDDGSGGLSYPRAEQFPISVKQGSDIIASIQDLSALARPQVRDALFIYLTGGKDFALRGLSRGEKYMPVLNDVRSGFSGMPQEVLYLPMLESGFCPTAVSKMQAVGVWQIIAPTAQSLGLRIDPMLDERRDVQKSTTAALRHIQNLKGSFPTWDLALAAYNCGSSRVIKGMRKYNTQDFWTLADKKALRKETADYIPHFAALALIGSRPDLFPVRRTNGSADQDETQEFEKFTLSSPVLISTLAKLTGIPSAEIYEMNPELVGVITPLSVKNYEITLPSGAGERLLANEDSLYSLKIRSITYYKIRRGDTISKISKRFGTDAGLILLVNNLKPNSLRIGKTILVPRS
jgi:membrane-bound lytic murein transglycosylase D